MKLTIPRAALLKALSRAAGVVEKRNTIPILSHVRLFVASGRMEITATDLDIDIRQRLDCDMAGEGKTTLPAHTLRDIVSKLSADMVSLEQAAPHEPMIVKGGRSRFTLQALPAEDFPDIAAGDMTHSFAIAAKTFAAMLATTAFAISTEETRYYLNGVFLHTATAEDGPTLRMVATDGHRLAQDETTAPTGTAGMPWVIVPRKAVGEIDKLLRDIEGDVLIDVSARTIRLTAGDIVFTSKLIDGSFPDYERVIPKANSKIVVADVAGLAGAADRVSTISSDRGRGVKMTIDEGRITLAVTNPDAGSAIEEIDAEYEGEPLDVGFNARYLADILGALGGDTARLELEDPGSPAVIRAATGTGGRLFVLMPMRVS